MLSKNSRYYHSSSFKMALLFTVLLGLSTILLGYMMAHFSEQNFIRETEAAIDADIDGLLELHAYQPTTSIQELVHQREARSEQQFYLYLDAERQPIAGSLGTPPEHVERITEGVIQFTHDVHGVSRILAAKIHTFPDGSRLFVARDIHEIAASFHTLQWLSVLIIALMALVVFTSFFISTFVVSRINRMASTARNIMKTGDLSRRLEIDSNWDDLSNLSVTLNDMLARIEHLMDEVRQVSDNIAHDLRTPLTRLRNRLEGLDADHIEKTDIDALITEADHLLETFRALLRIANVESGKRHQAFADLDLANLLQDVSEFYAPLAEEKNIDLQLEFEPAPFHGDRDLLFQAIANLLDNALKFTPSKGRILLSCSSDKTGITIRVSDSGKGVAEMDKPRVFTRFFRAEESRSAVGNGLGLSMVQAVVKLHQGNITLHDNEPSGLVVVIRFPNINHL